MKGRPAAKLVYELRKLTSLSIHDCVEALSKIADSDRPAFIAEVRANPYAIGPPPCIRLGPQIMPPTHELHQSQGPQLARCAVITVSDTRTLENDTGGATVIEHLATANHNITHREIIPDEPTRMRPLLESLRNRDDVDVILLTGGTGISSRDQTYETVTALLDKPLPGYGELFRQLSYLEIGPAAILSRAIGGLLGRKVLFTMPGSPAAVRLAMEKIIIPQIPHLLREARR